MSDSRFHSRRTFLGLPDGEVYRKEAAFLILPVPYDLTQSGWVGARHGPEAILLASSQIEEFDMEVGIDATAFGIATLPDVAVDVSGPAAMTERIREAAAEALAGGAFVMGLGGEHTVTLGLVQAHRERYGDFSIVSLDAHADLRDAYQGSRVGHATVMRRIQEFAPVTLVGIRSLAEEEAEFLARGTVTMVAAKEAKGDPEGTWRRVASSVRDSVYLTVDLDVFDPSLVPGVGTPEPGGLDWEDVAGFIGALLRERRLIGADVVEHLPIPGQPSSSVVGAKVLYRLIALQAKNKR